MTQKTRPEARPYVPTSVVYLRDPWDGFIFATTLAGVPEQLSINPKLEIVDGRR